MQDYKGEYIITDDFPLSTYMMELLTERPGVANIVYQVTQLTQDYNCSSHIPPLAKTDQDHRVTSSNRSMVWSFSSWLFQLGQQKISEEQNNPRLKMVTNLEGEGKASVEDFEKNPR